MCEIDRKSSKTADSEQFENVGLFWRTVGLFWHAFGRVNVDFEPIPHKLSAKNAGLFWRTVGLFWYMFGRVNVDFEPIVQRRYSRNRILSRLVPKNVLRISGFHVLNGNVFVFGCIACITGENEHDPSCS